MDPGAYFLLAVRLPAYTGILAARFEAERQEEESKPKYAPLEYVESLIPEGEW